MDPVTTPFERALHLLLFLSAALAFGVIAVAALERLSEGSRRTVRARHVVLTTIVFIAFFAGERIYHMVH